METIKNYLENMFSHLPNTPRSKKPNMNSIR